MLNFTENPEKKKEKNADWRTKSKNLPHPPLWIFHFTGISGTCPKLKSVLNLEYFRAIPTFNTVEKIM